MYLNVFLFALSLLFKVSIAHMEMQNPPPRRSKFNPFVIESNKDYDNVAPLLADGSDFPCKRYSASNVVRTFKAGSTYSITFSGSVFHMGGNCQVSISYNDRDFVSIYTEMKNCFTGTGLSWQVTIPSSAPSCDRCTLAWSWVNAVGNREFYMNCADIQIINEGSSKQLVGPRMVVANLPGYPTIPEFPPATAYGAELYRNAPTITISPGSSNASPPTSTRTSSTSTRTSSTSTRTTSSSSSSSSTRTSSTSSGTSPTGTKCQGGDSRCVSDSVWELCSNGVFYRQGCPRGTKCYNRNGKAMCDF